MEIDREGIWFIRKIKDGVHKRFITDKVLDLPDLILRASVEPYRKDITKVLRDYLDNHEVEKGACRYKNIKVRELVDLIFEQIKEK